MKPNVKYTVHAQGKFITELNTVQDSLCCYKCMM